MSNLRTDFKIDNRTVEDVYSEIGKLAASYAPEWVFDKDNPDIGSIIAMIFGEQLSGSIDRLNRLPEKYRTEFANMLNIGLRPAYPAKGVIAAELIRDVVSGVSVPKGTKLTGEFNTSESEDEDAKTAVFETVSDVYITNSRLTDIVAISPNFNKIIPISAEDNKPFKLFDFSEDGIQKSVLIMEHRNAFNAEANSSVEIEIISEDGVNLSEKLTDSENYKWTFYDPNKDAFVEFAEVYPENGAVVLKRGEGLELEVSEALETQEISEVLESYNSGITKIKLEALTQNAPPESFNVRTIRASSSRFNVTPSFVSGGAGGSETELNPLSFAPFGETASLFAECYIGSDEIFKRGGAEVALRFKIEYKEKLVDFTPKQAQEQLKIIKRKPRQVVFEAARTCAEKITVEYFNGTGFKKLELRQNVEDLFNGDTFGEVELNFLCPEDWRKITMAGNEARAIRIRLVRTDNCYLQPCVHNMPLIKGLKLSYSYNGLKKIPQKLLSVSGTRESDLTKSLIEASANGKSFPIFTPLPYDVNALYLGFDKKIEGSPVGIFFEIEENLNPLLNIPLKFSLEYHTAKGFTPLRILDATNGFTNSGTIMFALGEDFSPREIEGQTTDNPRYWLRICGDLNNSNSPIIKRIIINAAEIQNVDVLEEEEFFIEAASANMAFPLPADDVLSAEVYVNEKNLSESAMRELIKSFPDDVRVTYDNLNRINDFFVKWREVENFDVSGFSNNASKDLKSNNRIYVLDRTNNTIRFGDGIDAKIPNVVSGAAFTAKFKRCDGDKANIPSGGVNSTLGNVLFLENIENPVPTYGGSGAETPEQALKRGANIINSRNRLVSEQDFIREANAFSGMIAETKCARGKNGSIALVILTKDYYNGSYSFKGLSERLKERLLSRREISISEEDLNIVQPTFVKISVDAWLKPRDDALKSGKAESASGFELQKLILKNLEEFIEPIKAGKVPRKMGSVPTVKRLSLIINSISPDLSLSAISVTAKYAFDNGTREIELSALDFAPFMFAINGEHKIHIKD